MQRRDFIYKSFSAFAAVSFLSSSGAVRAAPTLKRKIVCFKSGSDEFLAADGIWHIAVLADPRVGDGPDQIPLNFEVSTDSEFQNIISTDRYFALKKNSYIVRVQYLPKKEYQELFYRFVATSVKRDASRGIYSATLPSSPVKVLRSPA